MSIKDGIVGAMVAGGGGGGGAIIPNINATAETLPEGSVATVTKTGSNTDITFQFGIPAGKTGEPGQDGQAATIQIGNVTTGAPGTSAAVSNSGTDNSAILDFTIPQGQPGQAATTTPVQFILAVDGWTGSAAPYSQTVTVQGITADNSAITGPATAESAAGAQLAGVRWASQGDNSLTYTAQTIPSSDLNYVGQIFN